MSNREMYVVVKKLIWKGRDRAPGDRIDFASKGSHEHRDRWLGDGRIRVATELEQSSPPIPTAPIVRAKPSVDLAALTRDEAVQLLPTLHIAPGPLNPRRQFKTESLEELGDSLLATGQVQPIVVRPVPRGAWSVEERVDGGKTTHRIFDTRRKLTMFPREIMELGFATAREAVAALPQFEIIVGERRWRACRLKGIVGIRAIVREVDDVTAGEQRLVENGQREDISPVEEAEAYQHMLSLPGYDVKRLVEKTGKKKSMIYASLALLNLPEVGLDALAHGRLDPSKAALVVSLDSPEDQAKALDEILSEDATVKEAKQIVAEISRDRTLAYCEAEARVAGETDGLFMLTGQKAEGIVRFADTIERNCGYVAALDVCPRDPRSRLWGEVIQPQFKAGPEARVTRYGVIVHPRIGKPKAVEIYLREEANAVLKTLGLWEQEGSEASKERERRAKEKEEAGRQRDDMMRDIDSIAHHARLDGSPRAAFLATVWAATDDCADDDVAAFIARRHAWVSLDDTKSNPGGVVRSMATNMSVGELQALVVELAIAQIGDEETYYEVGRDEMRELLDIEFTGDPANNQIQRTPLAKTDDE